MRLAFLIAFCLPVFGEAPPAASTVTKAPGDPVTLSLNANSQPSRAPVTLSWVVVFPAQLMDLQEDAIELGPKVKDSGKSLKCTPSNMYTYACTLSGGLKPIPDGLVAAFHFKIKPTAEPKKTSLRIEKAQAKMADSTSYPLNNTEVTVIIK